MATLDAKRRRATAKIVIYGPGLSGKTTTLHQVHKNITSRRRGRIVVRETESKRALPFELFHLALPMVGEIDVRVHVYTVPGQSFYLRTRKAVLKDSDAVLFVADSSPARMEANLDSYADLLQNLESHDLSLKNLPHVLDYNKRDLKNAVPVRQMGAELNRYGAPEFEAVATKGTGVMNAFRALLPGVVSRVKELV